MMVDLPNLGNRWFLFFKATVKDFPYEKLDFKTNKDYAEKLYPYIQDFFKKAIENAI